MPVFCRVVFLNSARFIIKENLKDLHLPKASSNALICFSLKKITRLFW